MSRLGVLCGRALTVTHLLTVALLAAVGGCGDAGFASSRSLDIAAALPPLGPREGGLRVALRGRGFVAGARVYFDGVAATAVERISETELRLTVPPRLGPPGPVEISVETPDERRATHDGLFTYYALALVAEPVLNTPVEPQALAALDLNRDGAADLVLARQRPPGLSILLSNGENPPTLVEQALRNEPSVLAVADA
jgi:hypothetical protein